MDNNIEDLLEEITEETTEEKPRKTKAKKQEEKNDNIEDSKTKREKYREMIEARNKKLLKKGEKINVGSVKDFNVISIDDRKFTGVLAVDLILQGLQKGQTFELVGEESSGKSTLLITILQALINSNSEKPSILFFNAEGSNNEKFFRRFPFLNIHSDLFFSNIRNIEDMFDKIEEDREFLDIICLDSVGAITSTKARDNSVNKEEMGVDARAFSKGFKRLYDVVDSGAIVLLINQLRDNITLYGAGGKKPMGGNALKFAKTASLELKPSSVRDFVTIKIDDKIEKIKEKKITIKALKNKNGGDQYRTEVFFLNICTDFPKETINFAREVYEQAEILKVIDVEVSGGFYTIKLYTGEELLKVRGRDNIIPTIKNNLDVYIKLKLLCYYKGLHNDIFYRNYASIIKLLEYDYKLQAYTIGEENYKIPNLVEMFPLDTLFSKEEIELLEKEKRDFLNN